MPYVDHVLVVNAEFGNYGLFMIASFLGILFTTAAAFLLDLLPNGGRVQRCMTYIGQNTFAIFVLNKPIIAAVETVFRVVPVPRWTAQIILIIAVIIVSSVVNELLKRYAPVLLGKYQ